MDFSHECAFSRSCRYASRRGSGQSASWAPRKRLSTNPNDAALQGELGSWRTRSKSSSSRPKPLGCGKTAWLRFLVHCAPPTADRANCSASVAIRSQQVQRTGVARTRFWAPAEPVPLPYHRSLSVFVNWRSCLPSCREERFTDTARERRWLQPAGRRPLVAGASDVSPATHSHPNL